MLPLLFSEMKVGKKNQNLTPKSSGQFLFFILNELNNRKQRGSIIVPFSLETNKIKGIDGEVSVVIVVTFWRSQKWNEQ